MSNNDVFGKSVIVHFATKIHGLHYEGQSHDFVLPAYFFLAKALTLCESVPRCETQCLVWRETSFFRGCMFTRRFLFLQ